jgi:hypothetical protein
VSSRSRPPPVLLGLVCSACPPRPLRLHLAVVGLYSAPPLSWRAPLELGAARSDCAVVQELRLPSTGTAAQEWRRWRRSYDFRPRARPHEVVGGSGTWWGRHRLALARHHVESEGAGGYHNFAVVLQEAVARLSSSKAPWRSFLHSPVLVV